jgi:hypothetical protein
MANPPQSITVPKLDDATVIRLFRDIAGKFKPNICQAQSPVIRTALNILNGQPKDLFETLDTESLSAHRNGRLSAISKPSLIGCSVVAG